MQYCQFYIYLVQAKENVISENYQGRRYEIIKRPQLNQNYCSTNDESPQVNVVSYCNNVFLFWKWLI